MQSARRAYHALRSLLDRRGVAGGTRPRTALSLSERAHFVGGLSYLINAHLPLAASIRLSRRYANSRMFSFLDRVNTDIENGKTLHCSLAAHCASFSPFALTLIRVGEECGTLGTALASVGELYKKEALLRSAIAQALVYPSLIVATIAGVGSLLAFYLFPKILPVIQSLQIDLPPATRLLIAVTRFTAQYYWLIAGALIGVLATAAWALSHEPVRQRRDRWIALLPAIQPFIATYESALLCRTVGLLLAAHVRISEALTLCSETTGNRLYRSIIGTIGRRVLSGESLSSNLARHPRLFPSIIPHMISVGEESGDLPAVCLSLADHFESLLEERAKRFAHILEPALMLALGCAIAFIATAIITPFYAITQQLQRL